VAGDGPPQSSISFIDYREMNDQAVGRLPQGVKVALLAAKGFIYTELMQAATTQLGWHYRIRLKHSRPPDTKLTRLRLEPHLSHEVSKRPI